MEDGPDQGRQCRADAGMPEPCRQSRSAGRNRAGTGGRHIAFITPAPGAGLPTLCLYCLPVAYTIGLLY